MRAKKSVFIHTNDYALKPREPKKDAKGRTVREGVRGAMAILSEGDRAFGSTPHIHDPLPPALCYGVNPLKLAPELKTLAQMGRSKRGRKLRKDARILLAGVASYPYTMEEVSRDAELREEFRRWVELLVRFLRKKWPDELRSVVIHTDEAYPHVHFYAVARMQDGIVMTDDLHPGRRASYAASLNLAAGPVLMKVRRDAFIQGMRDFQNDYYVEVGAPLGHARYGDLEPRVPYSKIKALRAQEKGLRTAYLNLGREQQAIAIEKREMAIDQLDAAADSITLDHRLLEVERRLAEIRKHRDILIDWTRRVKEMEVPVPSELEELLALNL